MTGHTRSYPGSSGLPVVSVQPMKLSGDRTDYYVSIRVGDREVTPHVFRDEQWKAEYEAATYRWLLLGDAKPDLLAYGHDNWPITAPRPSAPAQGSGDCGKLAYTSTGQIAACKCGSFPRLHGDGARPDDGYWSLWCQTCMEHVTSMMPSEREVIDHWNALREQEHAGEASSVSSTDRGAGK